MIETLKLMVWIVRLCVGAWLLELYRISVERVPIWHGRTPNELELESENKQLRAELTHVRRLYHPLATGIVGMAQSRVRACRDE